MLFLDTQSKDFRLQLPNAEEMEVEHGHVDVIPWFASACDMYNISVSVEQVGRSSASSKGLMPRLVTGWLD